MTIVPILFHEISGETLCFHATHIAPSIKHSSRSVCMMIPHMILYLNKRGIQIAVQTITPIKFMDKSLFCKS